VSVTVVLPGPLRELAGGASEVALAAPADTVAEALALLFAQHPALRDRVVGETGALREHVNLFVGVENTRHTGGLQTPLAEGAELTILPAISGG
jgi:molybdopterin synthase sulfur carrier subunit